MKAIQFNFEKAKKTYNDIMYDCGLDYLTIGTNSTEDKENQNKWNIRDLVAECDYQLSMFYEDGTLQNADLYDETNGGANNPHSPQGTARYCIARLRGFITYYKNYINGVCAHEAHSSNYDN